MKKFDIVIAGVGGQGILLLANILGEACINENLPVKGTETHGMSQRGGSVETHLRIGGVYGPKVPSGEADLLLALEPLEGARCSFYLKKQGFALINAAAIPPENINSYQTEDFLKIIGKITKHSVFKNFTEMTAKIGSPKILNVLMLGAAANILPLKCNSLKMAIKKVVKPQFLNLNLSAFNKGSGLHI